MQTIQAVTGQQDFSGDGTTRVFTLDFSANPFPSGNYQPFVIVETASFDGTWLVQAHSPGRVQIRWASAPPIGQSFTVYYRFEFVIED